MTTSPGRRSPGGSDGDALYLYFDEPHRRPHIAVRQGRTRVATIDLATGELLAGTLPPKTLRAVQQLLADHRDAAIDAFEATLRHEFPGKLDLGNEEGS